MIEQLAIAICGIASVWMSQSKDDSVRRWACIFGIAAQPFWMYATFTASQWGIFMLSFVYLAGWLRGAWNYWIQPWWAKGKS